MDEDKKDEDKKVPEVPETKDEPLSIVDEARAIRDEIVKAKEELKVQNDRQEKLQANELLGSSAGGRVETQEPKEETDEEFFEKFNKGEVNPFKEDGVK